jgi:hypothetical protein
VKEKQSEVIPEMLPALRGGTPEVTAEGAYGAAAAPGCAFIALELQF